MENQSMIPEPAVPEAMMHCEAAVVGGIALYIRPIGPQDAPRLLAFFNSLSPHSIYMRFFGPLKQLSAAMLEHLTRVDPERHIALVALSQRDGGQQILGVGRVIALSDPGQAEFSIVVADPWQGQGIGAALLARCIERARSQGVIKIWGLVLAENTQMLALGRKLGFKIKRAEGAEYELSIELFPAPPEAERTV